MLNVIDSFGKFSVNLPFLITHKTSRQQCLSARRDLLYKSCACWFTHLVSQIYKVVTSWQSNFFHLQMLRVRKDYLLKCRGSVWSPSWVIFLLWTPTLVHWLPNMSPNQMAQSPACHIVHFPLTLNSRIPMLLYKSGLLRFSVPQDISSIV